MKIGKVETAGNLVIDDTTDATSTSSAAEVINGGLGLAKSLRAGGDVYVGGAGGGVYISGGTTGGPSSRAEMTYGPASGVLLFGPAAGGSTRIDFQTSNGGSTAVRMDIAQTTINAKSGMQFNVDDTTEATSATSAAIQTDGGIASVKSMRAGGGLIVGGAYSPTSGKNLDLAGGATPYIQAYDRDTTAYLGLDLFALDFVFKVSGTQKVLIDANSVDVATGVDIDLGGNLIMSGTSKTVRTDSNASELFLQAGASVSSSSGAGVYLYGATHATRSDQLWLVPGTGGKVVVFESGPLVEIDPSSVDISSGVSLISDNTTDATSATSAAVQTDGGIASVKSGWIGDNLTVEGRIKADGDAGTGHELHLLDGAAATTPILTLYDDRSTPSSSIMFQVMRDGRIFANLPTSSAGLGSGELWNNSGVVNVA